MTPLATRYPDNNAILQDATSTNLLGEDFNGQVLNIDYQINGTRL